MEKIHKLLQSLDDSDVEIGIQLLLRQPGRVFNQFIHNFRKTLYIQEIDDIGYFVSVMPGMYRQEGIFLKIMKEYTITYDFLFFKVYRPKPWTQE